VPGDVGGPRLAYFLPESSEGVKNYQQIKEEKKTIDEEDQLEEAMEEDQEADPEPVGVVVNKRAVHRALNGRLIHRPHQFDRMFRSTSCTLFEITRSVNNVRSINTY
jgi:hypothetical protein